MNTIYFKKGAIALLGAGMLALGASSANAAVFIALEQSGVNSGNKTEVASDPDIAAIVNYLYGDFKVSTATGVTGDPPEVLNSSITAQKKVNGVYGKTLDIWITRTDVNLASWPSATFETLFPAFTLPANWSLSRETYVDYANGKFGGTLLSTNNTNPSFTQQDDVFSIIASNPFSVTQRYTVTSGNTNTSLSSSMQLMAVPEPLQWTLMIVGFFGMGTVLRMQRKMQAQAAAEA